MTKPTVKWGWPKVGNEGGRPQYAHLVETMRELRETGMSIDRIGRRLKVTAATVDRYLSKEKRV